MNFKSWFPACQQYRAAGQFPPNGFGSSEVVGPEFAGGGRVSLVPDSVGGVSRVGGLVISSGFASTGLVGDSALEVSAGAGASLFPFLPRRSGKKVTIPIPIQAINRIPATIQPALIPEPPEEELELEEPPRIPRMLRAWS